MCGIFGVIRTDGENVPAAAAEAMRDALSHRGPDHAGLYRGPGVVLGTARLAVVDLAGGNQPIFNADRSLVIVYNGEVYNHAELRRGLEARGRPLNTRSDTEVVLAAFEEYGPACLDMLDGMFAFAVWDMGARRLFLARDRLGIKPLYLAARPRQLAFSSEAKALLPVLPEAVQPDWSSIWRYLSYGYVPRAASAFQGITKLLPGHFAWFADGKLSVQEYWKPRYGQGPSCGPREACGRIRELMGAAVRKQLMADVPLGLFLSGGLDSSAVAVFARENGGAIESFGLRFAEKTHDESCDAALVARHLGLKHHELPFTQSLARDSLLGVARCLDEPFADPTVLPLLALSRFARERVKVALTGWGGDEVFAGYPTYSAHGLAAFYRKLPSVLSRRLIPSLVESLPVSDEYMSFEFKARRFVRGADLPPELQHFAWMGYFDDAGKKALLRPEILEQVSGGTFDPVEEVSARLEETEALSRVMSLDARFFLEGNGLFQADRMTMAASLEARVPLLDSALVDFATALPAGIKMPRGRPKGLLRAALEGLLPPGILRKPKKGFGPPCAAWTRGMFSATLERLLSRERLERQGVFDHGEARRLLDEHRGRAADHGRLLWALLSFQLWYARFIAREPLETLV